jgi:hypothetical protein
MPKEPEFPNEVFLVVFFGSIASIVVLIGVIKIADFWRRKKDPAAYRINFQKGKERANQKKQRRRKR